MEFSIEVNELRKNLEVLLKGKKRMLKWKKNSPPKMIIRANRKEGVSFEFDGNAADFSMNISKEGDIAIAAPRFMSIMEVLGKGELRFLSKFNNLYIEQGKFQMQLPCETARSIGSFGKHKKEKPIKQRIEDIEKELRVLRKEAMINENNKISLEIDYKERSVNDKHMYYRRIVARKEKELINLKTRLLGEDMPIGQ